MKIRYTKLYLETKEKLLSFKICKVQIQILNSMKNFTPDKETFSNEGNSDNFDLIKQNIRED